MPKPTFLNLPADKRERLTAIALEEFADNDYTAASVSRIVQRAGIAKGSIYQYFEDKQDFYLYLTDAASATLLASVADESERARPAGFFDTLRLQMSATAPAALAHPVQARLLRRVPLAPAPVREALLERGQAIRSQHVQTLVERAIASGELAPDLDPTLAAWFVGAVIGDMSTLVLRILGADEAGAAAIDPSAFQSGDLERAYDRVIGLLRNGLARRTAQPPRKSAARRTAASQRKTAK